MAAQNDEKKARLDRPYAGRRSMQEQSTNSDAGKEIPVLCRQIRFFREQKKIEQKELAEKCNIRQSTLTVLLTKMGADQMHGKFYCTELWDEKKIK